MALRSPAEADRFIAEAEAMGLNDSHLRVMRSDVAEARARAHAMAFDTAQAHFDRAHKVGRDAKDEFDRITELADAVAEATDRGELRPEEGRARLDDLLARHSRVSRRADSFEASVESCVRIEEDPEGWSEQFFSAHPSVRPEFTW